MDRRICISCITFVIFLVISNEVLPAQTGKAFIKPGHQTLVAENAEMMRVATGFDFVEGPVADRQGNVYFTDIPNNRIHIWKIENELKTFRENSGAANGLAFMNDSTLIVCEGGNRRLTAITLNGTVKVLAEKYKGKRLNSPNDVWIDPKGGIYFTDPRYGNRDNMEMESENVYYLNPDRSMLFTVITDMVRPNGIVGTPDGQTLYVADRGADSNFVYTIEPDGSLSDKRFFCQEGSDGMTLDSQLNVYITSPRNTPGYHVSVYNPQGEKLEEIITPEKPANVHFGGIAGNVLFITARTSLYAIKMRVKGIHFH